MNPLQQKCCKGFFFTKTLNYNKKTNTVNEI